MDLIDAVNFLEIQNTKSGNRNESRLRDLEGRASYIAKKTGDQPISWYEFTRSVPAAKPSTLRNFTAGAMIGMGIAAGIAAGAAFLFPPLAAAIGPALITGGIFGGLLGGYHNTENTSRGKQVDAYEQYLNQFEQAKSQELGADSGLAAQFERIAERENQFAANLRTQREKEECSCRGK